MLSPHERRMLDQIEEQLLVEDPALCRRLSIGPSAALHRWKVGACAAGVVLGVGVVVLGVLLLSLGLVLFGCLIGTAGTLAYARLQHLAGGGAMARDDKRDPGDDITPTWWTWA